MQISGDSRLYTVKTYAPLDAMGGIIDLDSLLSDAIHGFVVKDFLTSEEVGLVLNGFRNLQEEELIKINPRFNTYPISFAQFAQMVEQNLLTDKDYFKLGARFTTNFKNRFVVDVFGKLQSLFMKIKNAPIPEIPVNPLFEGNYVPFTFRELFSGGGCLKAHCENLFFHEFPSFFNRINAFTIPDNQLSFFIVLQEPGIGGQLTLFDILWHEKQKRPNDNEIVLEDGRNLAFDDKQRLRRISIPAETGSLVVFSGGKIWHRVETVETSPSRITLGGFLSFSHDRSKLYAWS